MLDGRCSDGQAFTLIELLCVMGLMIFLLAIALGSALGWGRSAGLRASVLHVKTSLALTRQLAVTHSAPAAFAFGKLSTPVDSGYYVVTTGNLSGVIGETNYLPKGFVFTNDLPCSVVFQSDGAATGDTELVVREIRGARFLAATISVARATGFVSVSE